MTVPGWVQDAIFYQIFPERFYNGDHTNDPPNVQPWGTPPTSWGFQGGDLQGILNKFDYLLDLGINAIYLNPIFQATTNHRYNTFDYYRIDPKLGSMDDFRALLDHAHKHQVKVILDGVFNHCGRGFFAFNDLLENQEFSPFREWFHIRRFPLDAYSVGEATDYLGWWGNKSLPKFNTNNQAVRKFLLEVSKYWIEQGADGWRLDVPNEIDDDSFWAEFRQVVKSTNDEAYIFGEIWQEDRRWVGDSHFDGLMNYPVLEALSALLVTKTLDVAQFADKVEGLLEYYPQENVNAMYLCFASHDTERLLTRMGNNMEKTRLAYLFQFAYPGAPAIYYGEEVGLTGAKDPGCRGAFPWEPEKWNNELRSFVKKLVRLRKSHMALRRGDYIRIKTTNPDCYAFLRHMPEEQVLVVMNVSEYARRITIDTSQLSWDNGRILRDLIDPTHEMAVKYHQIEFFLPANRGIWLA
jgi:cyclomaltodextrinase / maltogenic alpha-amylase / neopullulanase